MSNAFDLTVKHLREQGLNSDEILEELSKMFPNLTLSNGKVDDEEEIEEKAKKLLNVMCMPINSVSYFYWVMAIKLYKNAHDKKPKMMRDIYSPIAKKYGANISSVERAMRVAVEYTFERCPADTHDHVFRNKFDTQKGKINNSEFLAIMSELI